MDDTKAEDMLSVDAFIDIVVNIIQFDSNYCNLMFEDD